MKFRKTIDDVIIPLIGKNYKIIYMDYPIHFNIGDLAIYHGTEEFFRQNNIEVLERFNINNISYSRIKRILSKNKNILFIWHGGGNMGDTYFEKIELRRRTFMRVFPHEKIIFFPQSIFYKNINNVITSVEFYNRQNITILARDNSSFEFIQNNYPESKCFLCPDLAFYLEESKYLSSFLNIIPEKEKLILSRTDNEKIDNILASKVDFTERTDWLLMISFFDQCIWFTLIIFLKSTSYLSFNSSLATYGWNNFSKYFLSKGFLKLAQYKTIETDRLHGFIMSYLLGKYAITSDNHYGKIKNYRETWKI